MKFEKQLSDLEEKAIKLLKELIKHEGVKSQYYSEKVLKPDDEFMFNINGGGYIVEVKDDMFINQYGNLYDFTTIDVSKFFELIDHLIEIYG